MLQLDIKDMLCWTFWFQNAANIISRQAFLAIYILYQSDEASCDILSFKTSNDS